MRERERERKEERRGEVKKKMPSSRRPGRTNAELAAKRERENEGETWKWARDGSFASIIFLAIFHDFPYFGSAGSFACVHSLALSVARRSIAVSGIRARSHKYKCVS